MRIIIIGGQRRKSSAVLVITQYNSLGPWSLALSTLYTAQGTVCTGNPAEDVNQDANSPKTETLRLTIKFNRNSQLIMSLIRCIFTAHLPRGCGVTLSVAGGRSSSCGETSIK